jgi:hypothetical protein
MIGERLIGELSHKSIVDPPRREDRKVNEFLDEFDAILEKYPNYGHVGGPVDEKVILSVEKRLGLTFPQSYRRFVAKYGYGSFCGLSVGGVYPLATENNPSGSIILFNENARRVENIPEGILFIMVEDEYNVVIDTMQMKDEEAPVYEIELGGGYAIENMMPVAKSFGEYFLRKVKEAVDYLREEGRIK